MATLFPTTHEPDIAPNPRPDIEPDWAWKKKTKEQIEEGLKELVEKAREDRDNELRIHVADRAMQDRVNKDYSEIMHNLRGLAAEQYAEALQREREERRWAAGGELGVGWSEALVREQQAIWEALQREKKAREDTEVGVPAAGGSSNRVDESSLPPVSQSSDRPVPPRPSAVSPDAPQEIVDSYRGRGATMHREARVPSGLTLQRQLSPQAADEDSLDEESLLSYPPRTSYDHSMNGRQNSNPMSSRKAIPDNWQHSLSPNRAHVSRTFAHATSPSSSPVSPNTWNGTNEDSVGGLSRASSLRAHATTPDPAEAPSQIGRDRAGSGTSMRQGGSLSRASAKGKQPEGQSIREIRSRTSNGDFAHAWADPNLASPGARPSYHEDEKPGWYEDSTEEQPEMEQRGIPIRSLPQRWTPQSSPENTRSLHTNAAGRPIVNKHSFSSREAFFPSPQASPDTRRWHGPPSSPLSPNDPAIPSSRAGRPLVNQPSFTFEKRQRQGSLSPSPNSSARVRYPSPLQASIPRRDSIGSHSLRSNSSRQSKQEFFRPGADGYDRHPLPTHTENSGALSDGYESDEDYGIELSERRFEAERMREEEIRRIAESAAIQATRAVLETARREREELERQAEEARRQAVEARRREEEAKRREEEVRRHAEEARRKEEEVRHQAEEARRREEEAKMREEEAERKQLEAQWKEKEARKKEAEARRKQAELREKEEQAKRFLEEEAKRKEEEAKRKEQEMRLKEEEMRKREEALRLREAELFRREREIKLKAQQDAQKPQEEFTWPEAKLKDEQFIKQQEELWRRAQERNRHDSTGNASDASHHTESARSTASNSNPWPIPNRTGSTASSTSAASTTSSSSGASSTGSFWSASSKSSKSSQSSASSRASTTPTGNASTPTPTSNARPTPTTKPATGAWRTAGPPSSGASAQSSKSSSSSGEKPKSPEEEAWARRQAEQARKQQEAFQRMQEAMERAQEAKRSKILSKEEVMKLFEEHERRWAKLQTMEMLSWQAFPWPIFKRPDGPDDLTTPAISAYVLSPHHPSDAKKAPKDRIKEHIRRWHPDRFDTKLLPKVREDDRERVKEGAGLVARNLNELLTREAESDSLF